MSATRQTADLLAFAAQGSEHLESLQALLGHGEPPDLGDVRRASAVTRALRGSASLIGLDVFQGFLGRLFHLLEDVESSEVPWSGRLESVLHEAAEVESSYLGAIGRGDGNPDANELVRVEARLASWRREEAKRFEPAAVPDPQRDMSQSAASGSVVQSVQVLVGRVRTLRAAAGSRAVPDALAVGLRVLEGELAALGRALDAGAAPGANHAHESEEGLRNHCEGGLRHLVAAAAQEVLDEARERGVRLGLRATGVLDPVDDELGGALLEILRNLWSDSLIVQARGAAHIDTVLRVDSERLVVEVRDPSAAREPRSGASDDDVLGRYPGLRRTRPLVEALQGLVWVEPQQVPGCRFRVSLPRATESTAGTIVRVGAHEIALPPSGIDAIHEFSEVRAKQDQAGAFVEIGDTRYPVLHLAFVLRDVSYDELARGLVVVVGSFERRAAIFASGPVRSTSGERRPGPEGPWAGSLETPDGRWPLLDVGALLGRRAQTPAASTNSGGDQRAEPGTGHTVLVVNSSEVERVTITGLLGEGAYRTVGVRSVDDAMDVLEKEPVDLLVCDLRLPEMNAQRIAEHRRRTSQFADIPVLLVLSHAGEQSHLVVQQLGAADFVRSPVQREELTTVVKRLTDGS
ncbi:MAG: response regulator [Candidatus Krumholzibacteriia bacterium]